MRVATFAAPLSRDGPGLLLRDVSEGDDPQILAIIAVVDHVAPDILVLTDFDYDAQGAALTAFAQAASPPFPYVFSAAPNAGIQRGLDLDGDGLTGDARDALGYGRFRGDGGMAVLSRLPILADDLRDLTGVLWRDVPGAVLPSFGENLWPSESVFDVLPVSSTNHWLLPILVGERRVTLLAMDATPPVFDGPEDFNGLRNRAELRLFEAVLDGTLGPAPTNPILIGNLNIDPFDGDGRQDGIKTVLAHPDLQDPMPQSVGGAGAADPNHMGDPALDTVDWPDEAPGNLRVSYVLPSVGMNVMGSGVFWPSLEEPNASILGSDGLAAGSHRLVWVDIGW